MWYYWTAWWKPYLIPVRFHRGGAYCSLVSLQHRCDMPCALLMFAGARGQLQGVGESRSYSLKARRIICGALANKAATTALGNVTMTNILDVFGSSQVILELKGIEFHSHHIVDRFVQ
jgi:hypothetical protein